MHRICQEPRVWGAGHPVDVRLAQTEAERRPEAPSSKPEWLKTHGVGFELRRRNLLLSDFWIIRLPT